MNLIMNLSEALKSTSDMDRESASILGFCSENQNAAKRRNDYSVFLRRRNRYRKAA